MLIIDRIEEELAVVETDDGYIDVPLSEIEGDARDGAVLAELGDGYTVDEATTEERLEAMRAKRQRLRGKRNAGGTGAGQ